MAVLCVLAVLYVTMVLVLLLMLVLLCVLWCVVGDVGGAADAGVGLYVCVVCDGCVDVDCVVADDCCVAVGDYGVCDRADDRCDGAGVAVDYVCVCVVLVLRMLSVVLMLLVCDGVDDVVVDVDGLS